MGIYEDDAVFVGGGGGQEMAETEGQGGWGCAGDDGGCGDGFMGDCDRDLVVVVIVEHVWSGDIVVDSLAQPALCAEIFWRAASDFGECLKKKCAQGDDEGADDEGKCDLGGFGAGEGAKDVVF